jgi:hypothetical protein
MKVVNLFAGPGVGKSTTGAVLYGMLSMAGFRAEYVPEFAKFLTWQKHEAALADQLYLFAKQDHRLEVLRNAPLDFVIMDGPLPNAVLYLRGDYFPSFSRLVMEVFASYDNVNFFLDRNPQLTYQTAGRSETAQEAEALCLRVLALLAQHSVPFSRVSVGPQLPGELFQRLTGQPPPLR